MMLSNHECSWEAVVDAADGGLGEDARGVLAACASCSALVDALRAVRASFAEWRGFEAGDASALTLQVREAARIREAARAARSGEALASWRSRLAAAGTQVAEVWAVLTGDSWGARGAMAAVRASASAGPRFLQYATDDYTIAVSYDVEPSEAAVVRGQVVPRFESALARGAVAYWRAAGEDHVCPLSEFGEFTFDGVPLAGAEVQIAVGSTLIHIPGSPAA